MFVAAKSNRGFTLIELLIAIGLSAVVMTAVYNLFMSQNRTFEIQEQTVSMHQNLRVAMEVLQRDLRAAGFDPLVSENFGIVDVRNRDTNNNVNAAGEGSIQITADFDSNGLVANNENVIYTIYDSPVAAPDGITDLARQPVAAGAPGRQLLGEAVENLAFAYAYADDDGTIVMNPNTPPGGSPEPLWSFDSDNDNVLDRALDTNNDGQVDINDNPAGVALPNLISGTNLIQLDRIRAVKIWMLGRAMQPDPQYQAVNLQYKVGNRVRNHPNDNIRRQLLTAVVKFRNLGL